MHLPAVGNIYCIKVVKLGVPTFPKPIQKHQLFRIDAELAICLRQGYKYEVPGSATLSLFVTP